MEATAVTMCHGKLNCWPISSVYRFNLKVPARPINAKHTLRLLLRTVKISANKITPLLFVRSRTNITKLFVRLRTDITKLFVRSRTDITELFVR